MTGSNYQEAGTGNQSDQWKNEFSDGSKRVITKDEKLLNYEIMAKGMVGRGIGMKFGKTSRVLRKRLCVPVKGLNLSKPFIHRRDGLKPDR